MNVDLRTLSALLELDVAVGFVARIVEAATASGLVSAGFVSGEVLDELELLPQPFKTASTNAKAVKDDNRLFTLETSKKVIHNR